jgi:hypothetical protein
MTSSSEHINDYDKGTVPFKDYVIAVLDTPVEAKAAAEALEAGGFATDDVVLSAPLRPNTPESERKQGTLADPPTEAQTILTEEGLDQEQYAMERRRGHVVVQVHTPHREDVDRAHAILVAHQAHTIKRVGTWTRENLPEE